MESKSNNPKVISLAEWKARKGRGEMLSLSRKDLENMLKEHMDVLRTMLTGLEESLRNSLSINREAEKKIGKKISWDQSTLAWQNEQRLKIEELRDYIDKGNFILTSKDLDADDLTGYLEQIDFESLGSGYN